VRRGVRLDAVRNRFTGVFHEASSVWGCKWDKKPNKTLSFLFTNRVWPGDPKLAIIFAKGYRRLQGERDIDDKLPREDVHDSNEDADCQGEENLSVCLDFSRMSSNL